MHGIVTLLMLCVLEHIFCGKERVVVDLGFFFMQKLCAFWQKCLEYFSAETLSPFNFLSNLSLKRSGDFNEKICVEIALLKTAAATRQCLLPGLYIFAFFA